MLMNYKKFLVLQSCIFIVQYVMVFNLHVYYEHYQFNIYFSILCVDHVSIDEYSLRVIVQGIFNILPMKLSEAW